MGYLFIGTNIVVYAQDEFDRLVHEHDSVIDGQHLTEEERKERHDIAVQVCDISFNILVEKSVIGKH